MTMDAPVSYLTVPADLVNQAVDLLGVPGKIIGDITDGTVVAETARRNYGQLLRQLLRTAHWDFARKQAVLTLLGDATGQSVAPVSAYVESPWTFAYSWPIDAVQGRWLPWSPTSIQPTTQSGLPLTTGSSAGVNCPLIPGRFLVGSSDQYPVEVGVQPWDQQPGLQRTEGVGPTSRKIILTDCASANFVYTRLSVVIEEWDSLFRQALVTMLAYTIAPVAIEDRKSMLAERDRLVATVKMAVADARVANGNESGMPQSVDFEASFIRARSAWGWGNDFGNGLGFGGGGGYFGCGYDQMSFGGSVF